MTTGNPLIDNNQVNTNGVGILVSSVSPTITNNTINSNSTVFQLSAVLHRLPINSNNIYCNTNSDLNTPSTISVNATGNSWDHRQYDITYWTDHGVSRLRRWC